MRLGVAALVFVVLVPALAAAQPDAVRKKKARELLIEGDKKLKRGDQLSKRGKMEDAFAEFELALVDYQAAFESYPDPQIYFPIAQAEQRLGRFVEALQHYQQLLSEGKNITPALRDTVEKQLQDIKKNLASVVLDVKQDGAVILIDGREAARTPTISPIWVEPGQHTYAVTAKGFTPVEGKMDLLPGKELRRKIVLEPMPVVVKGGDGETGGQVSGQVGKSAPESATPPSKTPLWIGLGVTGALAISGSITGFAALSKHSTYRDESLSGTEREDARRDGKQLAGVTDVLLGGAVVAALVTAYYYYGVYQPRAQAASAGEGAIDVEEDEAFRITPFVGDGSAGVAASGAFW